MQLSLPTQSLATYSEALAASQSPSMYAPQTPVGVPNDANETSKIVSPPAQASVSCADFAPGSPSHSSTTPPTVLAGQVACGWGGVEPAGVWCQETGSKMRSGPGDNIYLSQGFAHAFAARAITRKSRIVYYRSRPRATMVKYCTVLESP